MVFILLWKSQSTSAHSLIWGFSKICFHLWKVRTHIEGKGIRDNNVQVRSVLIFFGICSSIGSLSTPPLCLLPYICCWPSEENWQWYNMRWVVHLKTVKKTYMDTSRISVDISEPGVKIWRLKSPVMNTGLVKVCWSHCAHMESFSSANARVNSMLYFPLANVQ